MKACQTRTEQSSDTPYPWGVQKLVTETFDAGESFTFGFVEDEDPQWTLLTLQVTQRARYTKADGQPLFERVTNPASSFPPAHVSSLENIILLSVPKNSFSAPPQPGFLGTVASIQPHFSTYLLIVSDIAIQPSQQQFTREQGLLQRQRRLALGLDPYQNHSMMLPCRSFTVPTPSKSGTVKYVRLTANDAAHPINNLGHPPGRGKGTANNSVVHN